MIDLHHHCLPGIDDGPRTWEESVALCRAAAAEGATTIVATPHVLRHPWINDNPEKLLAMVEELNERLGGAPRVLPGCEYYFSHDLLEQFARKPSPVIPLGGSRTVLVEFAAHTIPPMVDLVFYRLQVEGWTPLIAHPERNLVFRARPSLLESFLEKGARAQVTAGSLTGAFGEEARRTAEHWLGTGLVQIVASDAHNLEKRPPRIREARDAVKRLFGDEFATLVFVTYPTLLLEGAVVPFEPNFDASRAPTGFFAKIRRFLKGNQENR